MRKCFIFFSEYKADAELESESILITSSTTVKTIYWNISYNQYIDNSPEYKYQQEMNLVFHFFCSDHKAKMPIKESQFVNDQQPINDGL